MMLKVQGFSRVFRATNKQPELLYVMHGDRCSLYSGTYCYGGFRRVAEFDDADVYLDTLDRIAQLSGVEPVGGHRPYLYGAQARGLLLFNESPKSVSSEYAADIYRQMLDGLDAFKAGVDRDIRGVAVCEPVVTAYERLLGVFKTASDDGVVTFSSLDPA